jgi:endonuclease/exonuclease/phosphatase family metal-dependent hydrolase
MLLPVWSPATTATSPFTVVVYNPENLFDVDGVAVYEDYAPDGYGPAHLRTKLANLAAVLRQYNEGRGPDVILLQEIELDQTPGPAAKDQAAFLAELADRTIDELLRTQPLPDALAGLSAELWVLKALQDQGLTGYTAIAAEDPAAPHEDGNRRAIKNVTLSRFPVRAVRSHPTVNARHILETELEVEGHRFFVFNNHWKSGASDPQTEPIRIANARVLRARLDEILKEDPHADILVGGDLNSQYNQKLRYRNMEVTAINDILRSQGNELALRGPQRDLYNLWYELPADQRGSDTFRGEWGTLMHLIVSRGLYDQRGVQYVDNSFAVGRFPGLNADEAGLPVRWNGDGPTGRGFSDHFPLAATFTVAEAGRTDRWIALARPSDREETDARPVRVSHAGIDVSSRALQASALPRGANLRDGTYTGRIFLVEGPAEDGPLLRVRYAGDTYEVYSPDPAIRDLLAEQRRRRQAFAFYGELGTFRGRWQFVVKDAAWLR